MFMDSETAKAWGEQQAREIKNLKAMRKNERDRIIKIIKNMHGVGSYEGKFLIRKDDLLRAIRKHSQKTSKSSTAQNNKEETKTPDLHVKSTAQNE